MRLIGFAVLLGVALPIALAQQLPMAERDKEVSKKYREDAWAHFRSLCQEKAGEKIHKVVRDVDGLLLERPRPRPTTAELADRHWRGDPYGNDYYGDAEIASYLGSLNAAGVPNSGHVAGSRFSFVEVPALAGLGFFRFTLASNGQIVRELVNELKSKYAVAWEDISTPTDREYWVAGSRLYVIDRSTSEVLAERIGFLLEREFGSTANGRRPWLHARLSDRRAACPAIARNAAESRRFVEKVLVTY